MLLGNKKIKVEDVKGVGKVYMEFNSGNLLSFQDFSSASMLPQISSSGTLLVPMGTVLSGWILLASL